MRRWIKVSAAAVIGLGLVAAGAVAVAVQIGERKLHRTVAVPAEVLRLSASAAGIDRGRYLYLSRGCVECHGANGAGRDVVDDGKGMLVHAPNITPGPGGVVAAYADADWVRTIRHGVRPDGTPLMIMPSEEFNRLTDADLGALVAYLRQLPPAAAPGAQIRLPTVVKALYGAGVVKDAAEKIDHALPASQPVPEGATPQHGAYVANACIGCHGATLAGGKIPGAPPEWPAAANLTPGPGSALVRYADAAALAAMMRSGHRPDGTAVSAVMPFTALKAMSDIDVQALYLHLKRLPPRAAGDRG